MNAIASNNLNGKAIVVVGGGSGMGRSIAAHASATGGDVTIASRNRDKLEAAAQEIGGNIHVAPVDMTDEQAIRAWATSLGPVDHLVITASAAAHGRFEDLPTEDLKAMIESKFIGPYVIARETLTRINPAGSITFFSGALSRRPSAGATGLAAVNSTVETLTKGLAQELAGRVRVNCISPGMVATEAYDHMPAEQREQMYAQVGGALPVGRIGRAEEIARAALMVMANDFMTGAIVDVDGGHLVRA
ncbi:SDR family oxidoreductase [Roseobacter ponti]|uniref:SDR family oxidoreductase n=1 Tax=Roseobacter ponti TaxID=1891787 RepID=A0A858SY56_9RHOB|nr:SDR family oxidoreductase [Roseobacter ponti]QJF52583.1 SDR family oxidoreductase [Roseobacter ponti]